MADIPKFPGFPGQPGERWAFIKNIPSFFGGEDAEVDTSILPYDLGDRRLIESNEPFMPPDLTTVEPTDKYSQLERDWQNLQKIPEGTRDIFNRIVSEGEPASIWPVQELFPHIEPRSSNPIRSPFPPTTVRNPTVERMIRAMNPLKVDGEPPRRYIPPALFPKVGPMAGVLAAASALYSPKAHAPTAVPRNVFDDVTNPLHMTPVHFGNMESPFSWRNPGPTAVSQYSRFIDNPNDMWSAFQSARDQERRAVVEDPARRAIEINRQNTLQGLGFSPFTRSGIGTDGQLYQQRNDAEELRTRAAGEPGFWDRAKGFFSRSSDPNIPEVPEWNPNKVSLTGPTLEGYVPGGQAGLDSWFARPEVERRFFRDTGRFPTALERETGVWDATPKDQFRLKLPYEGMPTPDPYNIQGNLIQASLSPSVTYTPPPRSLGGSLEAMGELSRLDPRIADKYRTVTSEGPVATELMENLMSPTPVETFADIPAIQPGAKVPFVPRTPPAPDVTEALKSFTATRDAGEEQRNREQDQRERALEQAADDRRKAEQQKRIATARNKTAEKKRVAKENRERKAEEQRIASKQAKEEKQRRALEKQMADMLKRHHETHQAYLDRKRKEEDRRKRQGYGVGAMYT